MPSHTYINQQVFTCAYTCVHAQAEDFEKKAALVRKERLAAEASNPLMKTRSIAREKVPQQHELLQRLESRLSNGMWDGICALRCRSTDALTPDCLALLFLTHNHTFLYSLLVACIYIHTIRRHAFLPSLKQGPTRSRPEHHMRHLRRRQFPT